MSKNYLVIARVGDNSLHPQWLLGRPNFDVYISYFGDEPDKYREGATYYECVKGGKWPAIANIIKHNADLLENYDVVWVPDDDLLVDTDTINRMFGLFHGLNISYGQPALTVDSYFTYPFLLCDDASLVRYTNFVEVMAPIFSRDALKEIAPTIELSPSGWGLDFLWSKVFSKKGEDRVAVIDATPVKHTRPVGGELYRNNPELSPVKDWRKIEALFPDLKLDPNVKENKIHVNGVVRKHIIKSRFVARQVGKFYKRVGRKLQYTPKKV